MRRASVMHPVRGGVGWSGGRGAEGCGAQVAEEEEAEEGGGASLHEEEPPPRRHSEQTVEAAHCGGRGRPTHRQRSDRDETSRREAGRADWGRGGRCDSGRGLLPG